MQQTHAQALRVAIVARQRATTKRAHATAHANRLRAQLLRTAARLAHTVGTGTVAHHYRTTYGATGGPNA